MKPTSWNIFSLLLSASVATLFCLPILGLAQSEAVTIIGVSRDAGGFMGGIPWYRRTKRGIVAEKPVARLTQSGDWRDLTECNSDAPASCERFQKEFLNRSRTYTVVSSDGKGAVIAVAPSQLSECYEYNSSSTYSFAEIENSAIAASSPDIFEDSSPLKPLNHLNTKLILNAVASRMPKGLDSPLYFKFFSVTLAGQNFILVDRSVVNYVGAKDIRDLDLIFAIGMMQEGKFHILLWKRPAQDEDESPLGTIHLRNGRDFLLTSVRDPESQWFRVYEVRNGKLEIVYSGGRSGC